MLAKPDELLELLCHRWDAVVNMALAHEQGTHRYAPSRTRVRERRRTSFRSERSGMTATWFRQIRGT